MKKPLIKKGILNFDNSIFYEVIGVNSSYLENLKFNNCLIIKELYISNEEYYIKEPDTGRYKLIKSNYIKGNDRINAWKYHAKEMEAYRKEVETWHDGFILWFNSITNHGNTWIIGALFIALLYIAKFILFCFTIGINPNSIFAFILPLPTIKSIEYLYYYNTVLPWLYILIIILTDVLIYPTIIAFRKFSRMP